MKSKLKDMHTFVNKKNPHNLPLVKLIEIKMKRYCMHTFGNEKQNKKTKNRAFTICIHTGPLNQAPVPTSGNGQHLMLWDGTGAHSWVEGVKTGTSHPTCQQHVVACLLPLEQTARVVSWQPMGLTLWTAPRRWPPGTTCRSNRRLPQSAGCTQVPCTGKFLLLALHLVLAVCFLGEAGLCLWCSPDPSLWGLPSLLASGPDNYRNKDINVDINNSTTV